MDNEWIRNISKMAVAAVEETQPCQVIFGTVLGPEPKIQIDQKTILGPNQLILTRNVKDYNTQVTIPTIGKTAVTIHNGLTAGEKVILIQEKGGQKFIVIDRY